MDYKTVKPQTISDSIVQELRSVILEGVLQPGDRLPSERDLAQKMSVSRPSVREALQKLQAMGLVEHRQGGGTYVAEVTLPGLTDPLTQLLENRPEAIYDLIEFREALEGIAAYYAAIRATEADREIIRRRFDAIEKAHKRDDATEEAEADADFHLSIAEAAHNVVLVHVMRGVFQILRSGIASSRGRLYAKEGVRDALYAQHRALCKAVVEGDSKGSRQAVFDHLEFVKGQLHEIQREAAWEDRALRRLSALSE